MSPEQLLDSRRSTRRRRYSRRRRVVPIDRRAVGRFAVKAASRRGCLAITTSPAPRLSTVREHIDDAGLDELARVDVASPCETPSEAIQGRRGKCPPGRTVRNLKTLIRQSNNEPCRVPEEPSAPLQHRRLACRPQSPPPNTRPLRSASPVVFVHSRLLRCGHVVGHRDHSNPRPSRGTVEL